MDIDTLMVRIRQDKVIMQAEFKSGFLADLAEVYEIRGPEDARNFLRRKRGRKGEEKRVDAALRTLDLITQCPQTSRDRASGAQVIRVLGEIVREERQKRGGRYGQVEEI